MRRDSESGASKPVSEILETGSLHGTLHPTGSPPSSSGLLPYPPSTSLLLPPSSPPLASRTRVRGAGVCVGGGGQQTAWGA